MICKKSCIKKSVLFFDSLMHRSSCFPDIDFSASVLVSNGYPSSFVQKISKARTAPKKEPVAEFKSTTVLPYVHGVSEPLRRCLEQQGICTIFKSETTLRSHLVRPKDTVDPAKQDGVVYRIPCECGKGGGISVGDKHR